MNVKLLHKMTRNRSNALMCLIVLLVVFIGSFSTLSAQRFPVRVTAQVNSPAPIYLRSYANQITINSPIRAQLILEDLSIVNRQVALKVEISGQGLRFESRPSFRGEIPLFISGGTPLNLEATELAAYFKLQNLVGIPAAVYGAPLPEGNYQFCFEVVDVLTGLTLSNQTCTNALIIQNDPPLLVMPIKGQEIEMNDVQNIVFQWSPRGVNVGSVEYELTLVEIWNNQQDPQTVFQASTPIFTTTTNNTTFWYGPDSPQLLPNKRYAWRVQARSFRNGEEIPLFRNNGLSEIYHFDYVATCEPPQNISAEVKGIYQANIYWDPSFDDVLTYTVRYRQADTEGAQWFENKTTEPWTTLWDLKEGTTYEYQVATECELGTSDYSIIADFTTEFIEDTDDYLNCGITPDLEVANKNPIANITANETFMAGDFPVRITEIQGSNGRFTGKGVVTIPYLKNIGLNVKFNNILINTDKALAEGMVITTYDPTMKNVVSTDDIKNAFNGVLDDLDDIGDAFKGKGDHNEETIDFPIESVEVVKGKDDRERILVKGANGEEELLDYDEQDTYQITGTDKIYRIDKQGKPEEVGKAAEGGSANTNNTAGIASGSRGASGGNGSSVEKVDSNTIKVTFRANQGNEEETKYAYDDVNSDYERQADYPKTEDSDGNTIYAFHKAVPNNTTDVFYADVVINDNNVTIEDLIVKTISGREIPSEVVGNTLKITANGFDGYRKEEGIITYPKGDKQQVVANFFIHHLAKPAPIKIKVTPVGGAVVTNSFVTELRSIYTKVGIDLDIEVTDVFNPPSSTWDTNGDGELGYDGSGTFSNYPEEFKNFNKVFKDDSSYYDSKAYHLLVTDITTTEPLGGFMPKGRQFGYVFVNETDAIEAKESPAKTAAHELGHGIFGLEHPFKDANNPNTDTDWLMDYNKGVAFSKDHWETIGSPSLKLYLFQEDEDNESYIKEHKEYVIELLHAYHCAKEKNEPFQFYHLNEITSGTGVFKSLISPGVDELEILDDINVFNIEIPQNQSILNLEKSLPTASSKTYNTGPKGKQKTTRQVLVLDLINSGENIKIVLSKSGNSQEANRLKRLFESNPFVSDSYYSDKSELLVDKVNKYNNKGRNNWGVSLTTEIQTILSSTPSCVLELLPVETIVNLIEIITHQNIIDNNDEIMILKLIDQVSNKIALANALSYKDDILEKLFIRINNPSTSKAFIRSLIELGQSTWERRDSSEQVIYINRESEGFTSYEPSYRFNQGQLTLTSTQHTTTFSYNGPTGANVNVSNNSTTIFEGGVFTPVTIWNGRDHTDLGLQKGTTLPNVPAILAPYFIKNENIEDLKQIATYTLDTALLAFGVGEIAALYEAYRVARTAKTLVHLSLAVMDNAAAISDLVCQNSDSEACKKWQSVSFFVNIGLISASSIDLLDNANFFSKLDNATNGSKLNLIPDDKAVVNHIFSGKKNKFTDTSVNRELLEDIANNPSNLKFKDEFGKEFYAIIEKGSGKEIYIYVRNGTIKGAGYNEIPRFIEKCK